MKQEIEEQPKSLIIHAPSVHTGGGFVLLKELLVAASSHLAWSNLDERGLARLDLPDHQNVTVVKPTLGSRFYAELQLRRRVRETDTVLCFHGLPPLFRSKGRVIVFFQNRLLLGLAPLQGFELKTRLRLLFEKRVSRMFRRHVDEYIAQSPTMALAVTSWHGDNPRVRTLPFLDEWKEQLLPATSNARADFVYVADGEPHKNHHCLIAAWSLLAQEGHRPSLLLTVSPKFPVVLRAIEQARIQSGTNIQNRSDLSREDILAVYKQCRALVYPSTCESLGLPLIEATRAGLPIVGSELDFVRDVTTPAQTFDPHSPVSIARAIKRFLGVPSKSLRTSTAQEFVRELLG